MKGGCPHPDDAWTTSNGVATCGRCGTRRVVDYRALGQAVGPPDGRAPRPVRRPRRREVR
ncbi:DUF6255 family natural product biosynthesis protein [Streptomyces caatingaensis]|uniref:DUF6255 family natural product biosynthesis protein n=1 Tax=Streptomyces caatingaensis TaxID=1678637 RepID=UPI00067285CA